MPQPYFQVVEKLVVAEETSKLRKRCFRTLLTEFEWEDVFLQARGVSRGGGSCPAPSVTQCGGQLSNCWSVGEPDVDCPNMGLCCFNGCANVCQDQGRC